MQTSENRSHHELRVLPSSPNLSITENSDNNKSNDEIPESPQINYSLSDQNNTSDNDYLAAEENEDMASDENRDIRWSLKNKDVPDDIKTALEQMGFKDDDDDGIPTITQEMENQKQNFLDIAGQFAEGIFGDTRSVADRIMGIFLY